MNVTEQLDAMRVMGADPIRYLVVPRFVACIIITPLLTIYSDLLGVFGGWFISGAFFEHPQRALLDVVFRRMPSIVAAGFGGIIMSVFFGR